MSREKITNSFRFNLISYSGSLKSKMTAKTATKFGDVTGCQQLHHP